MIPKVTVNVRSLHILHDHDLCLCSRICREIYDIVAALNGLVDLGHAISFCDNAPHKLGNRSVRRCAYKDVKFEQYTDCRTSRICKTLSSARGS